MHYVVTGFSNHIVKQNTEKYEPQKKIMII